MIKSASILDFEIAFNFIEKLWDAQNYDKNQIKKVYKKIIENDNDFIFFLIKNNEMVGFCHGTFFDTFWLSGTTCYLSSLFVDKDHRNRGYAHEMVDYVKQISKNKNCTDIILDSGNNRIDAHNFYKKYGFIQTALSFHLTLE